MSSRQKASLPNSELFSSNPTLPALSLPTKSPLPNPTNSTGQGPEVSTIGYSSVWLSYPGVLRDLIHYPQGGDMAKKIPGQIWTSRSESDVPMFLSHNLYAEGNLNQSQEHLLDDLSSSSLVGSLSAGFAGTTEAPYALLNRESIHQAPWRRDHTFDSSRGLCSQVRNGTAPHFLSENTISQVPSLSNNLPWPNDIDRVNPYEDDSGASASPLNIFPIACNGVHGDHCPSSQYNSLANFGSYFDQSSHLQTFEVSEVCDAVEDLTGLASAGSQSIFNSSFYSEPDLISFDIPENFQKDLPDISDVMSPTAVPSPQCGTDGSPELKAVISSVDFSPSSSPNCEQADDADSRRCQYYQTIFALPSELKRHIRKHTRPYKCPHKDCNFTSVMRKDFNRHLNTRKRSRSTPRFFCHVEDCLYAVAGFTRNDNLSRHVKRAHHK